MKKREKTKITNSLMGFYQLVCALYDGLKNTIKDEDVQNFLFTEQIFQLILYHKQYTIDNEVLVPKINDLYKEYCNGFSDHVIKLEIPKMEQKKGDISYIT